MHWIKSEIVARATIAVVAALIASAVTHSAWSLTINHRLNSIEQDVREIRMVLLNRGVDQ